MQSGWLELNWFINVFDSMINDYDDTSTWVLGTKVVDDVLYFIQNRNIFILCNTQHTLVIYPVVVSFVNN